MLLRKCGEIGRGARSVESGRRRRHRFDATRVIGWPTEQRLVVLPEGGQDERGVGRALYETLFSLLRLQGYYVAHAAITLPNAASVGLHESLGFQPVGVFPSVGWKFAAWRDVGWWRLELQPLPTTPAPPLSLAEAQALDDWPARLLR